MAALATSTGVLFCLASLYPIAMASDHFFLPNANPLSQNTPPQIDPYEATLSSSEQEGPIKVLQLGASAEADYNGSFDPKNFPPFMKNCLFHPSSEYRYRTIHTVEDLCEKIQETSQIANISHLVLSGHGTPHKMALSKNHFLTTFTSFPKNCFSSLKEDAKIILQSCQTGKETYFFPNLAEWISFSSKKQVFAPDRDLPADGAICFLDRFQHLRIKLGAVPVETSSEEEKKRYRYLSEYADCTRQFHVSQNPQEAYWLALKMFSSLFMNSLISHTALLAGTHLYQHWKKPSPPKQLIQGEQSKTESRSIDSKKMD